MYRNSVVAAALGFATLAAANAGQVQIGGSTGLASSAVTGSAFVERNYDTRLYANASPAVTPVLTTGAYSRFNGQASGSTITDVTDYTSLGGPNGVTFSLVTDGCNGIVNTCLGGANTTNANLSNNFWDSTSAGTITVGIGQYGVTDVWTMLNDLWGAPSTIGAPVSNTSVTFNFGTSANAVSFVDIVTVTLSNALAGINAGQFGQIRSAMNCTVVGTSTCANFAIGPLAPSSSVQTTVTDSAASFTTNTTTTVLTKNLSSQAYTSVPSGAYAGSTGNAVLDSQGFLFGSTYADLFLVSIQITNNSGLAGVSQTALSAITVDSATFTTPEPASILLLLGGLGMVGISRLRRKA